MFHTRWQVLVAAGLCLAAPGAAGTDDAALRKERARLEGAWTIAEALHGGEAVEPGEPEEHEIKGTHMIIRQGNRAPHRLTLRLDLTTDPKLIDWTADPNGKFDDFTAFAEGIYKLEGDTLTVCYNVRDNKYVKGNRPSDFKSPEGSDAMLIVYKRAKK